jgi:hypothetical protein
VAHEPVGEMGVSQLVCEMGPPQIEKELKDEPGELVEAELAQLHSAS